MEQGTHKAKNLLLFSKYQMSQEYYKPVLG